MRRQLQDLSSWRAAGTGACLLAKKALEDRSSRKVRHEVAFFLAEEAARGSRIHLTVGRAIEWRLLAVILVDVASGTGRRRLSSCSGCCGWSGNSGHGGQRRKPTSRTEPQSARWLPTDPDLILHGTDQALHFGVGLFLKDLLDPTSSCDDILHRLMS